ncbi:MAG: response regulator [Lachnospiraceae bacterium]|nr:response regulator [Lachnospiraceae bacterium]
MKVLFVDDEDIIRESIQADFARMDHPWEYEVFTAGSVAEAEKFYELQKPQIVITDIQMPGGSGLILVEKIRQKNENCGILVLSAYDDYSYVRNAFTMGADDYILKPISFSELQNHVLKLAQKAQNQMQETEILEKAEEKQIFTIEDVLEYIKSHAAEKLSAAEMAKKMAVSYGSFGKIFKNHTNMSFSGYVLWYRMELAKEYLANPAIKIKQAASKVGYKENPQHFSRDFTRQTGLSPKEYRRQIFITKE